MSKTLKAPKIFEKEHVPLISNADFIRMELEQIKQYKKEENISDQQAAEQWITQHSRSLREIWRPFIIPKKELLHKVKEEIAKHRWIESEKKGCDLGVDAEMDWLRKHSRAFYDYWFTQTKEGAAK